MLDSTFWLVAGFNTERRKVHRSGNSSQIVAASSGGILRIAWVTSSRSCARVDLAPKFRGVGVGQCWLQVKIKHKTTHL